MITLILEAIREWVSGKFDEFLTYLRNEFGIIKTYDVMPSDEVLAAMAVGTRFRTLGYYTKNDGADGLYVIGSWGTTGFYGKKINDSKCLIALDSRGGFDEIYDVVRYGIRKAPNGITVASADITPENTYATSNSNIMDKLVRMPRHTKTLVFPSGRFFFERTINLGRDEASGTPNGNDQNSIRGEFTPQFNVGAPISDASYNACTQLCFPFLENDKSAIILASGNIENVNIVGNPKVYKFNINRTKFGTPDEIVEEVIATETNTVDGETVTTEIKCRGLYSGGSIGDIRNVQVSFFYEGIRVGGSNRYIENVYAYKCHTGLWISNDVKCLGVYGWYVHTMLSINGAISSAVQVRVDSCYHAVHIVHGSSITLMDVDGDICAGSLLVIGDNTSDWKTVTHCTILGLHGRYGVKKLWIDGTTTTNDASRNVTKITDSKLDYAAILIKNKVQFKENLIQLSGAGGSNPVDGTSSYRTPEIILAMMGNNNIGKNRIIINKVLSKDDILRMIDSRGDTYTEIQTINNWYTKKGNITVYSSMKDNEIKEYVEENTPILKATLPIASPTNLGKKYIYDGTTNGGNYHGCTYECIVKAVVPVEGDNPSVREWYELNDSTYSLSTDTSLQVGKTYYEFSWKQLTVSVEQLPQQ